MAAKTSGSSFQTALAMQQAPIVGLVTGTDRRTKQRRRFIHWKLRELGRMHSIPNNGCAENKHAHVMRCLRCVKVFGLAHLVRTVCKKKWWLSEILAQSAVLNWLAFFYFCERKDNPYSQQRIAFGWLPPLPPPAPAQSFADSDEEMLAAIEVWERKGKERKLQ